MKMAVIKECLPYSLLIWRIILLHGPNILVYRRYRGLYSTHSVQYLLNILHAFEMCCLESKCCNLRTSCTQVNKIRFTDLFHFLWGVSPNQLLEILDRYSLSKAGIVRKIYLHAVVPIAFYTNSTCPKFDND